MAAPPAASMQVADPPSPSFTPIRALAVLASLADHAQDRTPQSEQVLDVMRQSADLLECDRGELLEQQVGGLRARAGIGAIGERPLGASLAMLALTRRRPILFQRPCEAQAGSDSVPLPPDLLAQGIETAFAVPILQTQRPWGALCLYSSRSLAPDPERLEFLQAVACLVSTHLEVRGSIDRMRLRKAIFNSQEPMFVTDPEGVILQVNRAFCELYGTDPTQVAGTNARALDAEFDQRMPDLKSFEPGGSWTGEVLHHTRSGRMPIQLTIRRIDGEDDQARFFLGQCSDLSSLRRKEQELQRAMRTDAVGRLATGVAHDFNNLLGIVEGALRVIQKETGFPLGLKSEFDDAFSALRDGAGLARRLLGFSGAVPSEIRTTKLATLIDGMTQFLTRALGTEIEISARHDEGDVCITVDVNALESAVFNLAINARDAMPLGGELVMRGWVGQFDTINAEGFSISKAGEYAIISMTDTGSGIDESVLPFVFEPFYSTKGQGRSNGLGLSMVQRFMTDLGGTVHIASTKGKGTCVSLVFPSAHPDREEPLPPSVQIPLGAGQTVLVVEDEPRLRRIIVRQLEALNYHTLDAENAEQAIRLVESGQRIDLVFTDVLMPGERNGYHLALWLREHHPQMRVMLTSGHSRSQSEELFPGIESFAIIHKPFNHHDLALRVRHLLEQNPYTHPFPV